MPEGSNSIEHQLLVVKRRTDKKINNIGSNKDIVEVKRTGKSRITYGGNRKRGSVINNDGRRISGKRRSNGGQVTDIEGGVVRGAKICDPVGDRGRHHRHGVEGVGQRLLVPRAHPRCPRRWRRRHHGQRKGWADLLRRKVIGESAGQHGRRGRLLDVDPPPLKLGHIWTVPVQGLR
jgi:hypothetical protein